MVIRGSRKLLIKQLHTSLIQENFVRARGRDAHQIGPRVMVFDADRVFAHGIWTALKLRRAEEKVVIQYPTRAPSFKRLLGSPRQGHSQTRLLHRDQIKLAERLLIKQRPFLAISAAPVFMTTRNSDEIARADAFGTGIIPVQVGAT